MDPHPDPASAPAPVVEAAVRARTTAVLAGTGVLLALAALVVAGWFAWETNAYLATSAAHAEDSLSGLGYVFALVLAVPATVVLALTGTGFALRNRAPRTGRRLSIAALVLPLCLLGLFLA